MELLARHFFMLAKHCQCYFCFEYIAFLIRYCYMIADGQRSILWFEINCVLNKTSFLVFLMTYIGGF